MTYITLSLIAYALFAFTNVLDKVVLGHRRVDPLGYLLVSACWSPIVLLALPFAEPSAPGMARTLHALAAGAAFFWMLFPYFRAVEREDITRVAPLWQITPIFVWVMARITLGEELSMGQAGAFALLVMGGLLLAARRPRDLVVPSSALLLMLLADLLLAANNTLSAMVVRGYDSIAGYLLIRGGMVAAAGMALMAGGPRRQLRATLRGHDLGTHLIIGTTVLLSISGFLFLTRALQTGPVAVVAALSGVGGFFLLLFAALVARLRPGLIVEQTTRAIVLQKIAAIALLAAGLWLLNRGQA